MRDNVHKGKQGGTGNPRGSSMRPGAGKPSQGAAKPQPMDARKLALFALSDVVRNGAFSTLALNKHLSGCNLSHEDRRLATGIFYAALENRIRLTYVLSQFVKQTPEPVIEDILHIAAAQLLMMDRLPDHAVVDEAVKQVKSFRREGFVPLVNGSLRNLIRARDAGTIQYPDRDEFPIRHLSILHSMPEPVVKLLIDDYGADEAEAILSYRPDVREQTLRPNFLRYDADGFERYGAARGWEMRRGAVPGAFHVRGALDLGADEGFLRGEFSMISESSMLAAYAMRPTRGQQLLDACAAPGGKAAMLAELMGGSGRVHAWDIHEHRAELLRATARRLALDNLRPAARDARVRREELELQFDGVLIDAPCSGLGVTLAKPDIKYRAGVQDIAQLVALQREILDACSGYVAVGGLLVYSTCTITKDENERQALSFLERHPEFEPDDSTDWLPEALRPRLQRGMLQLLAHRHHMEGFFIARMRRTRL